MTPAEIAKIHEFYEETKLWRQELELAGYEVEARVDEGSVLYIEWGTPDAHLTVSCSALNSGENRALEIWFNVFCEAAGEWREGEMLTLEQVRPIAMKFLKEMSK